MIYHFDTKDHFHTSEAKGSLLWSVSREHTFRGYIFGTMHVRHRSAFLWVEEIKSRIDACEIYAAEMHLGEVDSVLLSESATLKPGQSLTDLIPSRKYDKVRKQLLKSFGMDLDSMKYLHPFLVISRLSETVLTEDHLYPLDQSLFQYADSKGKETTGLESFAEQMDIMNSLDPVDHIKGVLQVARNPEKFRKSIHNMVRYYESQDIQRLYQVSRKQLQHLRPKMLFQRNLILADRFAQLTTRGTVFAGFGAAHLGGGKGVIRLLKQQGFRVSPITIVPFAHTYTQQDET